MKNKQTQLARFSTRQLEEEIAARQNANPAKLKTIITKGLVKEYKSLYFDNVETIDFTYKELDFTVGFEVDGAKVEIDYYNIIVKSKDKVLDALLHLLGTNECDSDLFYDIYSKLPKQNRESIQKRKKEIQVVVNALRQKVKKLAKDNNIEEDKIWDELEFL